MLPPCSFCLVKKNKRRARCKKKNRFVSDRCLLLYPAPGPALTLRWRRSRSLHISHNLFPLAGNACCLRRPGGTRRSLAEVQITAWEAKAKCDEPGRGRDHTPLLAPEEGVCTFRRGPRKNGVSRGGAIVEDERTARSLPRASPLAVLCLLSV